MCLSTVTKKYVFEPKIGYKVFVKTGDGLFAGKYRYIGEGYRLHQWYFADDVSFNTIIYTSDNKIYTAGFHIFDNVRGLHKKFNIGVKDSVIVKVEYTNVVAEGIDQGRKTIVAKSMKLLEVVTKARN